MFFVIRQFIEGVGTISCPMEYDRFPFDSHTCVFQIGGAGWNGQQMIFSSKVRLENTKKQRPLQYEVSTIDKLFHFFFVSFNWNLIAV